ncbi:60S ribosomal protein L31-like [Elephas maximus indicus]|uniref:60S ribosomal protein L31-like n=1 Tax=Elephas maximus indicus TaxID=99487 RepID=UPI002116402B|nr:60S ribosomal protein L31-like [Elephas maximus indicus]
MVLRTAKVEQQIRLGTTAPAKKDGEMKSHSVLNEAVTREGTINIPRCLRGVGFKKRAPWALKESQKFAMKGMGTPDVHSDTRLNKALWAKGIRNIPYSTHVWLSRKHNEHADSPNKLSTLVTYVPVTTVKHLQSMRMKTVNSQVKIQNRKKDTESIKSNGNWTLVSQA